MPLRRSPSLATLAASLLVALLIPACDHSKATSTPAAQDAGAGSGALTAASAPGGEFPVVPANGILPEGAADKVLPAGRAPTVQLVESGAEPRATLAYAMTKGSTVPLGMALDMTMGLTSGDRAVQPTAIPRLTMVLALTTGDADAAGDARIDGKLLHVTVDPKGAEQTAMAEALRPALDRLEGFAMSYRVSPGGRVHDLVVQPPGDAPAGTAELLGGVSQSFESMVVPLPAVPIGVGARWRVVSRVSAAGPDLLQLATYTLIAREGSKATLGLALTQVAASDKVKNPGLPADVQAKLRSFHSTGTGTSRIDVTSVAPEGGTLTVESSMDVEISQGGAPGKRTIADSTMRVELSRPSK